VATYTVHLRLIRKIVVSIELYSLDVTAEALRASIDYKSAFLKRVGQLRPNFHVVVDVPCEPFLHG